MGDWADDRFERYFAWKTMDRDFFRSQPSRYQQRPQDIVWTTKDGRSIKVRDMEQSHRIHALALLKRKNPVEDVKASRIGWALNYYIKKWDEEHPPLGKAEEHDG